MDNNYTTVDLHFANADGELQRDDNGGITIRLALMGKPINLDAVFKAVHGLDCGDKLKDALVDKVGNTVMQRFVLKHVRRAIRH